MLCTCNPATLLLDFQNGVDLLPVGGNTLQLVDGLQEPR